LPHKWGLRRVAYPLSVGCTGSPGLPGIFDPVKGGCELISATIAHFGQRRSIR
jgi:hypothetical protein